MKTCQVEDCISPIWGKGFCKRHQYLRKDRAKKPFKPLSEKKPKNTFDFGFEDQVSMFYALWEERQNKDGSVTCKYTGEKLKKYSPFYFSYFAHLLPKKNYPYFKLNPANVEIVHFLFHQIIDQGTTKDRERHPDWKWEEWDAKVIAMKSEYQAFKKKHLLP